MPRRIGASHLNGRRWRFAASAPVAPSAKSVDVTFYHARTAAEGGVALPQPYMQKVLRAAPGDFPTSTTPTLYSGSTALPTQAGYKAQTWPDGSWRCGQVMALSPDTFAPNGQTGDRHSYTIKPVAGAGASTERFNFAAWVAVNNLRMVFRTNLADLTDDTHNFSLSLQEIVAAGIVEGVGTGSGYPLSSYRVDESGNVALRFKARGYLRRMSDGAYHTQIVGEFWVTAVGANSFRLTPRLGMPAGMETLARNPAQTVGPIAIATDWIDIPGIWEIWNNGIKTHTFGGPNDWRKVTLPANPIDLATSRVKFTNTAGDINRPRNSLAYVFESTGTLPSGIQNATPYFVYSATNPAQFATLYHQRGFLISQPGAGVVNVWNPNTTVQPGFTGLSTYTTAASVPANRTTVQLWYSFLGGTTGTTRPTLNRSAEVVDGTVTWMPVAAVMTDQGSGTITAWPVVTVCASSWAVGADTVTGHELWIGAGPSPELEVIDDLVYMMRDAKAFPPYDTTITPIYNDFVVPGTEGYSACEQTSPSDLNDRGDNPGDMRIGWLNYRNSLALIGQSDIRIQRACRFEAMGWQDRPSVNEDPRAFMPIVCLTGLNNVAGTAFPGLGGRFPDFALTWAGGQYGRLNLASGPGRYNSLYPPRNAFPLESSHLPACWIIPYHKTGNAMWIEAAAELANGSLMSTVSDSVTDPARFPWAGTGQRTMTLTTGGRKYAATQMLYGQIRSQAWSTRAMFTCDAVLPTAHPLRAYFTTMVNDATDAYFAAKDWMAANNPGADIGLGINLGYVVPARQLWECSFRFTSIAHEGGQGVHPRMKDVAEDAGRLMFALFDDANGGNSGLAGFNFARWCKALTIPAAGTQVTIQATPGNVLQGAGPYPPPIVYTTPTPAPGTTTALAQLVVAFINSQTSWTGMGYSAVWDAGGVFNIYCPTTLFNPSRHDGSMIPTFSTLNFNVGQNGLLMAQPNESDRVRSYFPSIQAMLNYNFGVGWPQGNSTTQIMDGSDSTFAAPHWFVYGAVSYYVIARGAMSTAAQMGIRNIVPGGSTSAQIAQRFNDRFRTTTNGPPIFTGGVAQSFWHGGMTIANFAIRDFADQAAHPAG